MIASVVNDEEVKYIVVKGKDDPALLNEQAGSDITFLDNDEKIANELNRLLSVIAEYTEEFGELEYEVEDPLAE